MHLAFHLALLAGVVWASWDRLRAYRRLCGVLDVVAWQPPTPAGALHQSALRAGLPADRLRIVHGLPSPAFTAGFWTPRVYLAAELPELLNPEQLHAVVAHEAAHVNRRDPLRLSALRFLACTLFYLPALRRLAEDAADEAEIAADDEAVVDDSTGQGAIALASALVEIARRWPSHTEGDARLRFAVTGVAGGAEAALLDRRVRRLLGSDAVVRTHVTRGSLASAGAALVMVWLSGLIMAHPLPPGIEADQGFMGLELFGSMPKGHGGSHDSHCEHHGAFALTHLFCLRGHSHERGQPCPHASATGSRARAGGA
ncbi:MAG: M48 family metalloprotease [Gemmatimonadaceae bacterium]|nr:M48 family metalloprotease [Gemmatimonadaceae bacterium]